MRKAKPKKRVILPDPVFNDQKVSKFVNHLMFDGKKSTSTAKQYIDQYPSSYFTIKSHSDSRLPLMLARIR